MSVSYFLQDDKKKNVVYLGANLEIDDDMDLESYITDETINLSELKCDFLKKLLNFQLCKHNIDDTKFDDEFDYFVEIFESRVKALTIARIASLNEGFKVVRE